MAPGVGSVASRASRRPAVRWFAMALTAVASLAIGRATAPSPRPIRKDEPTSEPSGDDREAGQVAPASVPAPVTDPALPAVLPVSALVPRDFRGIAEAGATPAAQASKHGTRRRASGPGSALQREAVTSDEARSVAERELVALRACANVPGTVIAELDIVRGRASVVKLNRHAPSDAVSWHGCARDVFERLEYPHSEVTGHVRVRFGLE